MLERCEQNHAVLVIYHIVGICSILLYFWFTIITSETFKRVCLDAFLTSFFLLVIAYLFVSHLFFVLVLGALAGVIWFGWHTRKLGLEWLVGLGCACAGFSEPSFTFTCRWRE